MADSLRKRILVAVDGSGQAMEAVRYVAVTIPPDQVEVILFHVITKVPESFWDLQKEPAYHYRIADITAWEGQQEKVIVEFMAQARHLLIEAGIPPDAVMERIQERKIGIARDIIAESREGYDAIVLGRKGLSELKDLVLGSIANKIVEKIHDVPVWVVGGKLKRGKFLIAMDSSEGAMRAVNHLASMLAGNAKIELTLFHVIRGLDVFSQVFEKSLVEKVEEEWMDRAQRELEEASRVIEPVFEEAKLHLLKAGLDPLRIKVKVVRGSGSRAGAIVDEVESGEYDTVVLGRRGLSRVQEFFMGRVSTKVIQLAKDRSVWVVS